MCTTIFYYEKKCTNKQNLIRGGLDIVGAWTHGTIEKRRRSRAVVSTLTNTQTDKSTCVVTKVRFSFGPIAPLLLNLVYKLLCYPLGEII